uniref:Annexin n=1 Tax=Lepisosteus oculatus TaxID=7918 RepID=W5NCR4_LEPOC
MDSYNTCPEIGSRGTVTEASGFNAEQDAQNLRAAMKGAGTDEEAIIKVLAKRTIAQRQLIKQAFKASVGKFLSPANSRQSSCRFLCYMLNSISPLSQVEDVKPIKDHLYAFGMLEDIQGDFLPGERGKPLTSNGYDVEKKYGETLEDAVCSDTSGMFKRVLVSLLTAGRDESSNVDMAQAVQDAKDIYEAGEARWGTDEVKFLTVLCVRNKPHLLQVRFQHYYPRGKFVVDCAIRQQQKQGGQISLEEMLITILKCIRNKPAFFAERLYKSMKGLGTTDSILIRVMVSRAEIDMLDIKSEFRKMYGKTLYSFIKGDASGDYRKILLELCGGDN